MALAASAGACGRDSDMLGSGAYSPQTLLLILPLKGLKMGFLPPGYQGSRSGKSAASERRSALGDTGQVALPCLPGAGLKAWLASGCDSELRWAGCPLGKAGVVVCGDPKDPHPQATQAPEAPSSVPGLQRP